MKALSLWQPWASLIAVGAKTIETRSWSTRYRGPIAIHASKREPLDELLMGRALRWNLGGYAIEYGGREDRQWYMAVTPDPEQDGPIRQLSVARVLPLGAVVATADLVDVVQMGWGVESEPPFLTVHGVHRSIVNDHPYGDYSQGRFAWLLEDVAPTTQRCPWCWDEVEGMGGPLHADGNDATGEVDDPSACGDPDHCSPFKLCPVCGGERKCAPFPARGKQGLWEWTP